MGRIVTISGASGAGKSIIVKELLVRVPCSKLVLSTTTREPRPSDLPGEYEYISAQEFALLYHTQKNFLWAVFIHGNHYGTKKTVLNEVVLEDDVLNFMIVTISGVQLLKGYIGQAVNPVKSSQEPLHPVLAKIDQASVPISSVGGHSASNGVKSIYILSPPPNVLEERIRNRGHNEDEVRKRITDCLGRDEWARKSNLFDAFINNSGELQTTMDLVLQTMDKF